MFHPQITLGQLIDLLAGRPQDQPVCFDFCSLVPRGVASYRGWYDHLAIGYREWSRETEISVKDFHAMLRKADGYVFTGYKGGDYRMHRDTPLWVANWGDSGSTVVAGLADCDYQTVIATAWVNH